jgi:hypothetical protein
MKGRHRFILAAERDKVRFLRKTYLKRKKIKEAKEDETREKSEENA